MGAAVAVGSLGHLAGSPAPSHHQAHVLIVSSVPTTGSYQLCGCAHHVGKGKVALCWVVEKKWKAVCPYFLLS